jgi:SAM-dependent methyltransferase
MAVNGLRDLATYSGDPWTPDNSYFSKAERNRLDAWAIYIAPYIKGCDFSHAVDLAAGHGRNSVKLAELATRLTIMDIQAGNIEVCKRRFAERANTAFIVNNGFDFQPIGDSDVTFIFCFDAMVHFDSDVVRSYLRDAHRILVPGGRGFLHHSNYTGGHDWRTNLHSRNFMSKELFAHYAIKEGLQVVVQAAIDWVDAPALDCLSLVAKPL